MKSLLTVVFGIVFFFLTSFLKAQVATAAENFLFLNSDQFEHLTTGEQKIYIKTLQDLIVQFDVDVQKQSDPQVSVLLQKYRHWMTGILPSAQAQVSDEMTPSSVRSNNDRIENSKISYALVFLDSRITAAQDLNSDFMRQDSRENFFDIYDRLKALSRKNLSDEQRKNFNANLAGLLEKYNRILAIAPDLSKIHAEITEFTRNAQPLRESPSERVTQKPSSAASRAVQKPSSVTAQKSSTKGSESLTSRSVSASRFTSSPTAVSAVVAVTAPSSVSVTPTKKMTLPPSRRCIYSGFVIHGPCTPLKTLPDSTRLVELGSSDFKCKSPHEILCNPLVFGYQSDLSPYCTVRSTIASKNCQEISNNSENLIRLHQAWKNPTNKKIFDDFQSSLISLCDTDNKNLDIRNTCKVVVAQFNEKVKKEFPAQLAATDFNGGRSGNDRPNENESKTGKSLRTN